MVEEGGIDALINKPRRSPSIQNRVDDATEQVVIAHAVDQSAHGQYRASNELVTEGALVPGRGVRSIWVRHSL